MLTLERPDLAASDATDIQLGDRAGADIVEVDAERAKENGRADRMRRHCGG